MTTSTGRSTVNTKRILGILISIAVASSAVSIGTVAYASPGHDHDSEKPAKKQGKKPAKKKRAAEKAAAEVAPAVGSAFGTVEAPRSVTISMPDDLRFEPGTIVVAKGETIRFLLDNPTATPHDFTLGDLEAQEHHADEMAAGMGHGHDGEPEGGLPSAVSLEPGESTEVLATFDEAGEILVGCHVPGHWEAGMRGALSVVDLSEIVAGTEAAPREIPIAMTDGLRFDPETIAVTAGETVRFVLDNPTAAPHDFTIGDADAQQHHAEEMAAGMTHGHDAVAEGSLPGAVSIAPGEMVEVLATFDELGARESLIGCHVPGHWEAGMRGSIVVLPTKQVNVG
jgi:uncharacterized cupredoxin-like copper-binding protein